MNPKLTVAEMTALVVACFSIAVIAGFNVGQAHGMAASWHDRPHSLEKVMMALRLPAEQMAKAEPVIAVAHPRIYAIESDARKKKREVIQNALSQIRPILTPDQQMKLDELQAAREDLHSARDKVIEASFR
jgi:Spy/CpxP family protein refolding chaperone